MLDVGKIRRLREAAGLSQGQSAQKAGIGTRQRWHGIESGANLNIELETLYRIAKAVSTPEREGR